MAREFPYLAGIVGPRAELEFTALLVERVVSDVDYAHRVEHACNQPQQSSTADFASGADPDELA